MRAGVEIPKPDGRKRKLGIPTVLDRFIQQAIAQVMQEDWDSDFHEQSYGFRRGRNAHQAIRHTQATIKAGYRWVVDCDLDAFFDRVNHDRLMVQLKQRTEDDEVLRLINRYLKAGVRVGDKTLARIEGVPQGGPLSPVLSNIVLNELDWELDRRGHHFARYADDIWILVRSPEAGERVMASLQRYVSDSLRLQVNTQKSAVDRPWKRTFLGITFSRRGQRIKVSAKALQNLKRKIRRLCRRTRGHSLPHIIAELTETLLGWTGFCSCKTCISTIHGGQSVLRY